MPEHSQFDICIIGTGAGGAPIASFLAEKGLRIAIIDRGSNFSTRDAQKDEFVVCRKPGLHPDITNGIREITYGNSEPIHSNHLWTATCIGGGTRIMSGFFFRMQPEDFIPLSIYGSVPNATHIDWPIRYSDLSRYYDTVEQDIGITKAVDTFHQGVRLPPLKAHPVSALIDRAATEVGIQTFTTPRAILSKEVADRSECSYSGFCGSYVCLTGAKASTHETYIKRALLRSNVTLFSDSFAYSIETSKVAATRVRFFDKNNVPRSITAKTFVVACGAIETARLLFNSKNQYFSSGIANSSGQLGKNLTFTIPCEVTGFFPKDKFCSPSKADSPFVQRCTQSFHTLNHSKLSYKRGGTVVFLFPHPNPIQRVISLSQGENGERIWGSQLKDRIREYFNYNHLQTDTFIDFLPNTGTHISISHTVKDSWGIPGAKIVYQPHPENIVAASIIAEKITELFSKMGAIGVQVNPSPFTAGELQHGTCRFGENPAVNVIDPFCRSHDIKNLFITDSSFMCSGLPIPSTFTIMANSLRVGSIFIHMVNQIFLSNEEYSLANLIISLFNEERLQLI